MNDEVIYKQAAIDALKNRWKKTRNYEGNGDDIAEECELYLKQVPSAQPEIVRCGDCKHYYFADNRIPQEQRYTCELDGDRWNPDSFCSFAERRNE